MEITSTHKSVHSSIRNLATAPPDDEKITKKEFNYKRGLLIGGTAATAGIVAFVAAPIVIPAVVGALGFGTGGIAAGSTAASLMSLGGGVTPVAVSLAQSVGATTLISSSTTVATGTAAGVVGGCLAALKTRDKKKDDQTKTD